MTTWTDQRIGETLTGVGQRLDWGTDTLDVVAILEAAAPPAHAPRRRLLAVAAAVLLVVAVGTVLAVTPTREAIADWFGIGRTEIVVPPSGDTAAAPPIDADRIDMGATTIDSAAAEALLGRPLPVLPDQQLLEVTTPTEGGVVMVYPGGLTLWVQAESLPGPGLTKKLVSQASLTWFDDLGDGGALIEGPHTLITPGRELRADSVVLWTVAGLELRLEGDLPPADLVELARSVTLD